MVDLATSTAVENRADATKDAAAVVSAAKARWDKQPRTCLLFVASQSYSRYGPQLRRGFGNGRCGGRAAGLGIVRVGHVA
jgi:hypothetical protein